MYKWIRLVKIAEYRQYRRAMRGLFKEYPVLKKFLLNPPLFVDGVDIDSWKKGCSDTIYYLSNILRNYMKVDITAENADTLWNPKNGEWILSKESSRYVVSHSLKNNDVYVEFNTEFTSRYADERYCNVIMLFKLMEVASIYGERRRMYINCKEPLGAEKSFFCSIVKGIEGYKDTNRLTACSTKYEKNTNRLTASSTKYEKNITGQCREEIEIRTKYPSQTEGMALRRDYFSKDIDCWYSYGYVQDTYYFYKLVANAEWNIMKYDRLEKELLKLKYGMLPNFSRKSTRIKETLDSTIKRYVEEKPDKKNGVLQLRQLAYDEIIKAQIVENFSSLSDVEKCMYVDHVACCSYNPEKRLKNVSSYLGVTFGVDGYLSSTEFFYCVILSGIGNRNECYAIIEKNQIEKIDVLQYRTIINNSGIEFDLYVDCHGNKVQNDDGSVTGGILHSLFEDKTYEIRTKIAYTTPEGSLEPETDWYMHYFVEINMDNKETQL